MPSTSLLNAQILISGTGTNAVNIATRIQNNLLTGLRITQVISNNPDAPGIDALKALGLEVRVVNHREFPNRTCFEAALAGAIQQKSCDLIVLAGFMRILSFDFVKEFAGKVVNIHPSLLPAYKGLRTHQRALEAQDEYHGVSVHLVTPDLDAGPVIGQAILKVRPTDTAQTLEKRVQTMEYSLYPACLQFIASGTIQLQADRVLIHQSAHLAQQPNATGVFTWTEDEILNQTS